MTHRRPKQGHEINQMLISHYEALQGCKEDGDADVCQNFHNFLHQISYDAGSASPNPARLHIFPRAAKSMRLPMPCYNGTRAGIEAMHGERARSAIASASTDHGCCGDR